MSQDSPHTPLYCSVEQGSDPILHAILEGRVDASHGGGVHKCINRGPRLVPTSMASREISTKSYNPAENCTQQALGALFGRHFDGMWETRSG